MKSALNARLLTAAEFVRQNATFADIGTDHAYLPLFLLDTGRINYAVCSDINEGPLASARRNAEERGMKDKMDFVLTDGATLLGGRGITDYAICGMGGELIADIIGRAPHLKDREINLILQPMSRQAHLRRYLAKAGFEVKGESYSFDQDKYYVCLMAVYTGVCRDIDEIEAECGNPSSVFIGDKARQGYLKTLLAARERALRGKKLGGVSDIPEEKVIKGLRELLSKIQNKGETV